MNEYEIWSTYQTSLISRAMFMLMVFFMAWFACRVSANVAANPNSNLLSKVVTSVFGLVVVYFGIVQQAFTVWTNQAAAYSLAQLEDRSDRFDNFIAFFSTGSEPTYSIMPDPFTAIFWLCIALFILVPLWIKS